MSGVNVQFGKIQAEGRGTCEGGEVLDPPIHDYPLLVWDGVGHPVRTEDGKATVEQIALVLPEMPSTTHIAIKFGTTPEHVRQAIHYALDARLLHESD